jgi:hypothetical protein
MIDSIQPYLKEIAIKTLDNGDNIYSCIPKDGIKVLPTGYQKTEQQAIEAFYTELIKKGHING